MGVFLEIRIDIGSVAAAFPLLPLTGPRVLWGIEAEAPLAFGKCYSLHSAVFPPAILPTVTWHFKSSPSQLLQKFPQKSLFYHNIDLDFEYIQGLSIFLKHNI